MAKIYPGGWEAIDAVNAHPLEVATLRRLGAELPDALTVYHGIHWTRVHHGCSVYGELDFIIVGPRGQVVVIEQKNGGLFETAEGLVKLYQGKRKVVAPQIQRSIQSLQDRFRQGHRGVSMPLDYLLYCPDYRVASPATAGVAPERIVDAGRAAGLCATIMQIMDAITPIPALTAEHVCAFIADDLDLAPDPSALVGHARQLVTRLSDGLATWARQLEFDPFRLRVVGTAGSGKTQLALRVLGDAAAAGLRARYVCFNRPLADHLRRIAPPTAEVGTFHMLADQHVKRAGGALDFRDPGAFAAMTTAFMASEPLPSAMVDVLVIDEGQDFEQVWADALLRFLAPGGRAWWLEDPMQNLYNRPAVALPGWTTLRADVNYRTPRSILADIGKLASGARFVSSRSPIQGDGIVFGTYADPVGMRKATVHAIVKARAAGFKDSDIVVLSYRGRERSELLPYDRISNISFRRFAGAYDESGSPVFDDGEILLETIYRFKGQSAPCVIFTEVDFGEIDDRVARRLYVGTTRASMHLVMIMSEAAAGACVRAVS